MSFLTPFFLWLLPLTAIPLLIHLLNRRHIITIDFSTLRFLKMLERESIRKLKFVQFLLLMLRTIIILLIIFMITRPIIRGDFNVQRSGQSALHAFILDDSFSIKGNSEIIEKTAKIILDHIPNTGQLMWLNMNQGLQYTGLKEDVPPLENLLQYTYLSGNLIDGMNELAQNIHEEYASMEVYILTDGQHESFMGLIDNSDLYENMHIFTIVKSQLNENLSITNVALSNEILLPNHVIDLEVSIKNTGVYDQENTLLQLIIDNMSVGQQLISLPSGKHQTFLFKTALSSAGTHPAMVEINGDEKEEDNRYFFNLNIPYQRNIALISNSQKEYYYIQASIKALNNSGESLRIAEYLSLDDKNLQLENYDAVFITSNILDMDKNDSKVEEYLYNGGHLIILPGINSEDVDFHAIQNILPNIIDENYKDLSYNKLSVESFQNIDLSSIQFKDIYNLFLSKADQERNIKLFKYITLPYSPEYSKILLNDGNSVWNRYSLNKGIIDVFGFSMDLNWSNFPIKGTFLPFIHFVTYSLTNGNDNLYKHIGDHWNVVPEEYYSSTIFHVMPDGSREIINANQNNHLVTDILQYPGYHIMQTNGVNINQTAVNIKSTELISNCLSIESLQDAAPENMQIISMESDVLAEIKHAQIGIELWHYCLYLIIFLLMLEMLIANVQRKK